MDKKKKICFVVAVSGSARSFLKDHIKALQKNGFDVHLAANFTGESDKAQFESVTCHDVPIERKIHILRDFKAIWLLWRVFKRERFYAIHSVTPKAALVNALAGWMARVPHRIHIFTGQVWCNMPKGVKRWLLVTLDKLVAALDTRLLADSKPQRQYLIDNDVLKESNSFVIGDGSICGVNLKRFEPKPGIGEAIRRECKIAEDRVVYILLGRLNHDKGIGELFEAFNRLTVEAPKAFLLLVGYDEEGYDKKAEIYPNITRGTNYLFYGPTTRPNEVLQAADVFVLPTWREGFGSSVIEASCVGLPVIASDTYGVMDAMVDDVTGLRCHVNDPESLYECMKKLYDAPGLRKRLGENGRKRVIEKFSGEVITQAWVDFYKNL